MRKRTAIALLVLLVALAVATPAHTEGEGALAGKGVCIDPGHGGSDPGAVNAAFGLEEADINLDVSYALKALLEDDGGVVWMTREGDDYLTNSDRYTFCNGTWADILVSVHTNSVTTPDVDGSLGLYMKEVDVPLARVIQQVMYSSLSINAPDGTIFTDFGLTRFASGVLLKSDMPATIAEPLFMSNPGEAELLTTRIYRDNGVNANPRCRDCRRAEIAAAIHQGVLDYFGSSAPEATGRIQGVVTDAATGARLGGVLVETDTGQSTQTNRGGRYTLNDVPVGEHLVTASKDGYVSQDRQVTVSAGEATVADFALTK